MNTRKQEVIYKILDNQDLLVEYEFNIINS